jgi:putative ABC transport system permease protein
MLNIVIVALLQGFEYGLVTLGVMLSFRVIRFPDLTIEGSFSLGGAITASIIAAGVAPIWEVIVSIVAGFSAGFPFISLFLLIFDLRLEQNREANR